MQGVNKKKTIVLIAVFLLGLAMLTALWQRSLKKEGIHALRLWNRTLIISAVEGYEFSFPKKASLDDSLGKYSITVSGEGYSCSISREWSPYLDCTEEMTLGLKKYAPYFPYEDGIDQYIGYYQSRFLLNNQWQEANGVSVSDPEIFDASGHKAYIISAVLKDAPQGSYDGYSFVYIKTESQFFIRMLFKYDSKDEGLKENVKDICQSFKFIPAFGGGEINSDYYPLIPDNWTEETAALYQKLCDNKDCAWGIYTEDIFHTGINEKVPELEEKLNYQFDVVLAYIHSSMEFPSDFMEKSWQAGRVTELTYQITNNNNSDFFVDSPFLDIYRGEELESIRAFARAAKEFGHPFLLRICNEMNSDWTSYGGVVNLSDPSIYIDVWRRMYRIFEEEGVNNCIWVFNPNDRPAPPCNWNNALCYYPGNEYVQMIGVTGYNNGNYYKQWAEEWREFENIYDLIEDEYGSVFSKFPWMITEFASSSYGGDKAKWIESMFNKISKYEKIKIAVWFSAADYTSEGFAARPYWLDETADTLEAFRKGLAGRKSGLLR